MVVYAVTMDMQSAAVCLVIQENIAKRVDNHPNLAYENLLSSTFVDACQTCNFYKHSFTFFFRKNLDSLRREKWDSLGV